jgi:hypothetical protein
MNGAEPLTVYKGLANQPGVSISAYDGLTRPQEAITTPNYETNSGGLRSPYPPPKYVPPANVILV